MTDVALHPRSLDFISLCTGGGGLDLGLELAIPGARPVCLVEREAFAVAHLVAAMREGLLAPAPVWSDARTFDGRRWRGLVDGVIGGIPCQPFSNAGKRRGRGDPRDLWGTARRIIVQSGAWFVLIENVGGMLSAGDDEIAGAERVWRDLRRLGFAVEGGLFTAAEVGASHERERLFILAVADRPGAGWGFARERSGQSGESCEAWRLQSRRLGGEVLAPMADADGERLERLGADAPEERRSDAGRPAGLCDRAVLDDALGLGRSAGRDDHAGDERDEPGPAGKQPVVDAASFGRREGRPEPGLRRGRDAAAGAGLAMGDPARGNGAGAGQPEAYHASARQGQHRGSSGGRPLVDAEPFGRDGRPGEQVWRPGARAIDEWAGPRTLFPPGPGDVDAWRGIARDDPRRLPAISKYDLFQLACRAAGLDPHGDPRAPGGMAPVLRAAKLQAIAQSTLRRMADGMASRVDELRMLGNGVVPLEAAYAVRTLGARLAAAGSAGAAFLVDLMGEP